MKILNKIVIAATTLGFLLTGCAGTPINFGNINKDTNLSKVDFSKGREISASSGGFQLLLFIPIGVNDRQESAYEKLKEKAGQDYIADIEVKESWTYAVVGTVYKTKIKAKAYPYKK